MSHFERDTAVVPAGDGRWNARVDEGWSIDDKPNGGYLTAIVVRALRELSDLQDPVSVTTHFLRPGVGDAVAEVHGRLVRPGRQVTSCAGSLHQEGKARVEVMAMFGDLDADVGARSDDSISIAPPRIPPPEQCLVRNEDSQGVDLKLRSRVENLIAPTERPTDKTTTSTVDGWLRLADGAAPDSMSLVTLADTFIPSVFANFGRVGWVPSLELTVHVRRRPVPGWLQIHLETDDLDRGRLVESGSLWDSSGALVARCRQLALVL